MACRQARTHVDNGCEGYWTLSFVEIASSLGRALCVPKKKDALGVFFIASVRVRALRLRSLRDASVLLAPA